MNMYKIFKPYQVRMYITSSNLYIKIYLYRTIERKISIFGVQCINKNYILLYSFPQTIELALPVKKRFILILLESTM